MTPVHDVARIRLDNALLLFDEFVQAAVKVPDAATLRGLERRFAERLQIQPSYWSQIKGRSRQIGERLARQFEQLCRKPVGWMDLPHPAGSAQGTAGHRSIGGVAGAVSMPLGTAPAPAGDAGLAPSPSQPQDDDERFIIGLVLTYYRRHPQRARTRLLDLLGEVLTPTDTARPALPPPAPKGTARTGTAARAGTAAGAATLAAQAPDDLSLWLRTQSGVAPLKRKP